MNIASFDVFDTCLLRKCGTVADFYDVLSLRAFREDVPEQVCRLFAVARKKAEDRLWNTNSHLRLSDIYADISFSHPSLKPIHELVDVEIALEKEMLVPSARAKALVDKCRKRGHRVVFVSDMYLEDDVIRDVLAGFGFYYEDDGLYVSSTCGCTKQSGELYKYVQQQEKVPFRKWHHYGDNAYSDVAIPSSLGIKATRYVNDYSPYQKSWLENDFSQYYDYPSILAGISRAMNHSDDYGQDRYVDFVVDLIAPLYCSYVHNVLKDAYSRGVRNLYFCARDTWQIFHVAEQMVDEFPGMRISYLYVSRDSLYAGNADARLAYFEQVGLANHEGSAAIVDITTSGKTIWELNRFLVDRGYCQVRGYFLLLWDDPRNIPVDRNICYFELEAQNIQRQVIGSCLLNHLYVFENFFALNTQAKTVDYTIENGVAKPVKDNSVTQIETDLQGDKESISRYFTSLLTAYAKVYITTGIYRYSKEIMHAIAIPTLSSFFRIPELHYLPALEHYRVYSGRTKAHVPYVLRTPKVLLKLRTADSAWWTASALWSLPGFLRPLYRRRLKKTK